MNAGGKSLGGAGVAGWALITNRKAIPTLLVINAECIGSDMAMWAVWDEERCPSVERRTQRGEGRNDSTERQVRHDQPYAVRVALMCRYGGSTSRGAPGTRSVIRFCEGPAGAPSTDNTNPQSDAPSGHQTRQGSGGAGCVTANPTPSQPPICAVMGGGASTAPIDRQAPTTRYSNRRLSQD